MPRRVKKVPTKKRFTKRPRRYAKRSLIPRNVQYTTAGVIPKTKLVNFCYRMNTSIASPLGGAAGYHQFRLNSIFDPDYTGVGHQPLGHDEWSTLYKTYKVLGSKITVKFFWGTSSTVGQAHNVGITFDKDTTVGTVSSTLIEKAHGRCVKLLKPNSRESHTIVCYWSGKKAFGKAFLDHQHESSFGSNPTTAMFATVWAATADSSASTDDVHIDVLVEYITLLSDPVDLIQS